MSHEIKFRVWDKFEKRFDENHHLAMDLNGRVYNLYNGAGGDDYEIQQSTGILDKNGKEIYEGDILELSANNGYYGGNTGVVQFHNSAHIVFPPNHECDTHTFFVTVDFRDLILARVKHSFGNSKFGTIVGNIFQNPELLQTP